jgi:peptide/nickel transport system substrate-binding protein
LYNAEFNAAPIGTGPFRVAGRTRNGILLEANGTYHFGPPHIATIEFRVIAEEGSLVEELRDGDIDGALFAPDASNAEIALLEDDGRFVLHRLPATSANVIYLDTTLPLFADVAVRGALVQAVNPQSIIDEIAGGRGAPTDTGIANESWAHADVAGRGFSPGDAARALELAGWRRSSDGIRQNSGVRLSFALSAPNEPARVAIAENVAQQWRAIGAEVEIIPIESSTYVNDHLLPRSFQAALVEVDSGPDPDPYPFWHSSEAIEPGRNLSGFSSADLDNALQRGRLTADIARRKERYQEFASFVIAGAPFVPLYTPQWTYVHRRDVQGFVATLLSSPALRFANVYQWYIETRVRQ